MSWITSSQTHRGTILCKLTSLRSLGNTSLWTWKRFSCSTRLGLTKWLLKTTPTSSGKSRWGNLRPTKRGPQHSTTTKGGNRKKFTTRETTLRYKVKWSNWIKFKTITSLTPSWSNSSGKKTLYKMQKQLWVSYENEWARFKSKDHLNAQAPIPPCCRILTLHIFLTVS